METIGRLASGLAHDFNNLLTAILGHCDLLLRRLSREDPSRRGIEEIQDAGERAGALTRQLLAYSRRQVLKPQVLDLNANVTSMLPMLRRLIDEDIELIPALESTLGHIEADPSQIEQVVMNLVVNARDSMPSGGRLVVETSNADLDETFAKSHSPTRPGRYVMLAVSDTGSGMDEETKARIFEPFFTTKELGKGTGIGLATVYGIVKQSGGYIWVYSEQGMGSTFKIYLPRVDAEISRETTSEPTPPLPRGRETVLLVEDDRSVLLPAREMLEMIGYKVLEAHDGREALDVACRHGQPIDLLLTDVVMPHMSGRELAESIATIQPGIRVLYMSGYTEGVIIHHGALDAGVAYLQKPFTSATLARKVREALDTRMGDGLCGTTGKA
ncbi:MAG TPA: ATP-binding protein [Candidatus Polarisedimenticolia bacterium]|nr:ATP-binding protein [Candidatus Polarisedimenticolia bacterium]